MFGIVQLVSDAAGEERRIIAHTVLRFMEFTGSQKIISIRTILMVLMVWVLGETNN